MASVFVQFSDESKTEVVASFACAQDPKVYPHLGELADDDPRYLAFLEQFSGTP